MSYSPLRPTSRLIAVVLIAGLALTGCSTKKKGSAAGDLLAQGVAAQQANDFATAIKDYNAVLAKDPKNTSALFDLGLVAAAQGNSADAESNYRKALAIDPNLEPALYNLAILRTALGDRTGAVGIYRRAVAADPNSAAPLFNLGVLLRDLGRTAEGDADIAKARQLDPSLVNRSPGGAVGAGTKAR